MPFALRILIFVILVLLPIFFGDLGQNARAAEADPGAQTDQKQLEINRDALFNSPSENIRIDTAVVMLYSNNDMSRQVLLEALQQKGNVGARVAVCRALSQTRRKNNRPLEKKEVFIEPLLNVLKEADPPQASLVSEACLIFDYQVIGPHLEALAQDTSASESARLNAIHALQLQPYSSAATPILGLVDDDNKQIAQAAKDALDYMQARGVYIAELQSKSKDEFLRDWLISQEERMRQERAQKRLWVELFFKAIDQLYANIDDKDIQKRAEFLITHLQAPQTERTLWALNKVYEWRLQPEAMPEGLTPVLIGLVSSGNRSVRLEAARQLSYMGRLESAPNLLVQLDKEKDDEVRTELFTALGAACKSALLNGGIPGETRTKILGWSARFLGEPDATKAIKGADVIGKLLEKDGMAPEDIGQYLGLLQSRYGQSQANTLNAELLRVMASLCADRSACRGEARKHFQAIFERAVGDETDRVREEAVLGLTNVDKVLALNALRMSMAKEKNARIRARIIGLAGEVGDARDLQWLVPNLGSDSETDASWQALLKILARSEPTLLEQWMPSLVNARRQKRVSDGLWQAFLRDAERKAEKRPVVLAEVLRLCVDFYRDKGELKQAKVYLTRLIQARNEGDKTPLEIEAFALDLRLADVNAAVATLTSVLSQRDLDEKDGFVQAIETFLQSDSAEKTNSQVVQAVLKGLNLDQDRPNWEKLKVRWVPADTTPEAAGTAKQN